MLDEPLAIDLAPAGGHLSQSRSSVRSSTFADPVEAAAECQVMLRADAQLTDLILDRPLIGREQPLPLFPIRLSSRVCQRRNEIKGDGIRREDGHHRVDVFAAECRCPIVDSLPDLGFRV